MSVKIFAVFIFAAIGTAAGYIVMRTYKRNVSYMRAVCELIADLKRNISYRRDGAVNILSDYTSTDEKLNGNIKEYLSYATAKNGELSLSKGFLPQDAYRQVKGLFSSLGAMDDVGQLNELKLYEDAFSALKKSAEEKSDKYGALAVKLGFLFGLAVGILFL